MRLTEHVSYVHQGKQPPTCGMCMKQFIRREVIILSLNVKDIVLMNVCSIIK